ncbi:hypothetical protein [Methanospirillum hungatei]|uniref:SWIM zinc finger family protein n=1 Tax=Methanospirillum hungatei TaxID=2203 RepID=UPI0026EA1380|nr:hypothetical protein [Methanospirillum hungatei]MCA1916680.1 hypothetical protein [Methanospirillum hungatei]
MRRRKNRWWINSIHDVPEDRKITLKAQDGPVGKSWYARDFVRAMEAVAEKKRLARGLDCARKNEAARLVFRPGLIRIGISCSGYTIRDVDLSVTQFRQSEWDTLIKTIAADASLSGALVSGEFSEHFVDELRRVGIYLLPSDEQGFYCYCNCGDHHDFCIHKIAARYFIAEALDDDPWNLLYIRGKSRDDVLNAVRQVKSVQAEMMSRGPGTPVSGFIPSGIKLPDMAAPTGFFTCEGEGPLVPIQKESVKINPIKLLGKSPYYFGRENMADAVTELYPSIFSYADSILPDEKREKE